MTDDEFLQEIEACTLPKEAFTHRNHVRLAWLYLSDRTAGDPDTRIATTIRRYATSIGAATKYDHELTLKWMRRVEAAMAGTPAETFDAFLEAQPELMARPRISAHMIGTTGLHNLRIDCIVGVYEHERVETQPLFLDVEVDYDFAAAAVSDDVAHAVDYDQIAKMVTELAQARKFKLLEAMAEAMAALIFDRVPVVQRVGLEIRKPEAVPAAANSFVRVERRRS